MSVEYKITECNDVVTRGDGGVPTATERSFTVEAIGGAGNYKDASFTFFQWVLRNRACDPWGNPVVEGGIELTENADSLGRFWSGRVRWEFPSSTSFAGKQADAATRGGDESSSSGDGLKWYPYISSFTVAGGTRHVVQSLETTAYPIAGPAVNFGGGIGWDGDGFEGVDVPCPAITFNITGRTPEGFVGNFASFLNKILPFVGTVNADPFYGCAPGTVLFNGITSGSLKTGNSSSGGKFSYWEMNFSFSAMPNVTVNVCGVPVKKGGWQYLWNLAAPNGMVQATYVETVFPSTMFSAMGLNVNPRL